MSNPAVTNDRLAVKQKVWNVPNQLTAARVVLSVICFGFLAFDAFRPALFLFAIAAGTDWFDGYWARKYGQITQLGRVLDPFADKVIICGTYVFLAAEVGSEILPWMAVVVIARELLVTALRSFFEERQIDFSAKWAGKWKMVFQCLAAVLSLYKLGWYGDVTAVPDWLQYSLVASLWVAIATTIYSGWEYVRLALSMMRNTRDT
ncbi:MAG: CDP-diacylglycerol--glycerol-3-phosphate 3-phosphatidyltransferase [Pirellulales bacterium]